MMSDQTAKQQSDKSKGEGPDELAHGSVNRASVMHAAARVGSGSICGRSSRSIGRFEPA